MRLPKAGTGSQSNGFHLEPLSKLGQLDIKNLCVLMGSSRAAVPGQAAAAAARQDGAPIAVRAELMDMAAARALLESAEGQSSHCLVCRGFADTLRISGKGHLQQMQGARVCLMLPWQQGLGAGLTELSSHKPVCEEHWERAERERELKQGTGKGKAFQRGLGPGSWLCPHRT